jgi:ABC-2 type transport system permease protein
MPIFDQGYQHFHGQLAGPAWRWLAITRQGVRAQLKNRLVRILLLLAWLPALALVVALALWGLLEQKSESIVAFLGQALPQAMVADPVAHRRAAWTVAYSFFFQAEMFFIMLLIVVTGPGLISRDLRFNALPLYFARPLRRVDYFLGKLGVIGVLVAAVAVVPGVLAYVLGVCFSLDLTVVRDTYPLLLASAAYGLVIVVSAGTLMLALSSLSRRSLFVALTWFGVWMISGGVAGVLIGIQHGMLMMRVSQEVFGDSLPAKGPMTPQEQARMVQTLQTRQAQFQQKLEKAQAEAARTNWRLLFSYTANLHRIGEGLLRTDAAWVEVGRAVEAPRKAAASGFLGLFSTQPQPPINERRFADMIVPQYPWTWSAAVLAGLFGLSLWILTSRVKSLDRLK